MAISSSSLRRLSPGLGLLALLVLPAVAFARAGGGHSYSGGGHSGGGHGGGGGGDLIFQLIFWLLFRHPVIGIPLVILILFLFIRYQKSKGAAGAQPWTASTPAVAPPLQPASRDLDGLRALDPEFSVVLFEDFAYDLFARAHQARSSPQDLEALSPYLSAAARGHLAQRRPVGAPVSAVVIGAMRVVGLTIPAAAPAGPAALGDPPPREVVVLELEANMTVGAPGAEHTHYVEERWRLERDASVQTKPPEKERSFHCPNCGAPFGPEGGTAASTAARWSPAAASTGASSRSTWCGSRSARRPSPPTSRRWARTSPPSSIPSWAPAGPSWCATTPA